MQLSGSLLFVDICMNIGGHWASHNTYCIVITSYQLSSHELCFLIVGSVSLKNKHTCHNSQSLKISQMMKKSSWSLIKMTRSMNWLSVQWYIILFEWLNLWIGYLWKHLSLSLRSVDKMKINLDMCSRTCRHELFYYISRVHHENIGVTFNSHLTFQPHIKAIKRHFFTLTCGVQWKQVLIYCSTFTSLGLTWTILYLKFKININHHTPSGLTIPRPPILPS